MSKRVITFGQWDGKPIKWLVLKEDGFKTLVISKCPLFSCRFNENRNDGNLWKTSSLRNYLNSTFWETAFSAEEKKKVVNCMLEHPDHTKDNVFVLSKEEAENLLTQKERTFGNEFYDKCRSCAVNWYNNGYGVCSYLRSSYSSDTIYRVRPGGSIDYTSMNSFLCIHPALYLKE
ncbi:MAG: DUF6273 domain-containing protein [Oliverpabstia sp.]|nr:DUF6273 domain-containing protein [Oliverpabstia sp.]